jgi:hypothetical protein
MSDLHFKHLEKYSKGRTGDRMNLEIPVPRTESGKAYRHCPNDECTPRVFLIGNTVSDGQPASPEKNRKRRESGQPGMTCPYCGTDAEDSNFTYPADVEAAVNHVGWAASQDVADHLDKMFKGIFGGSRSQGLVKLTYEVKGRTSSPPVPYREDLLRNLACHICAREYGVYAIALFCPDCGSENLRTHFGREIELIDYQIEIAGKCGSENQSELGYRLLGNAHEDVLTSFETYMKTLYRFVVRKRAPQRWDELCGKGKIKNRFQNVHTARALFREVAADPFSNLTNDEFSQLALSVDKRHLFGHNLGLVDEAFLKDGQRDGNIGMTVPLLADDVRHFVRLSCKVVTTIANCIEELHPA